LSIVKGIFEEFFRCMALQSTIFESKKHISYTVSFSIKLIADYLLNYDLYVAFLKKSSAKNFIKSKKTKGKTPKQEN